MIGLCSHNAEPFPFSRPYLRRFGQILEGFFLLCILSCLMISIVDSFNNLEVSERMLGRQAQFSSQVTHPESHCWRDCCKRRGKCSKEICKAHENVSDEMFGVLPFVDRDARILQ
eukprot:366496-Hanusia_phi.AAC.4